MTVKELRSLLEDFADETEILAVHACGVHNRGDEWDFVDWKELNERRIQVRGGKLLIGKIEIY